MEVKYFKVKHKVLKNSLHHGQIWFDFENFSLKMSVVSCQLALFQNDRKKNSTRQILFIPGKIKITKVKKA
jgi:hypothetical protein